MPLWLSSWSLELLPGHVECEGERGGGLLSPKPSTVPSLSFGPTASRGRSDPRRAKHSWPAAHSGLQQVFWSTWCRVPLQEEVSCFVPKSLRTELATGTTLRVVITVPPKCHCMVGKAPSHPLPLRVPGLPIRLSETFVISSRSYTLRGQSLAGTWPSAIWGQVGQDISEGTEVSTQGRRDRSPPVLGTLPCPWALEHPPQPCPPAPLQNQCPEEGGSGTSSAKTSGRCCSRVCLSFPTCKVR